MGCWDRRGKEIGGEERVRMEWVVACGGVGTDGEGDRQRSQERERNLKVLLKSNEVKGELSWSCAIHMTRTHVNF
jgi:hypothetical protein